MDSGRVIVFVFTSGSLGQVGMCIRLIPFKGPCLRRGVYGKDCRTVTIEVKDLSVRKSNPVTRRQLQVYRYLSIVSCNISLTFRTKYTPLSPTPLRHIGFTSG